MAGWDVAVLPVADERFSVVLVNLYGRVMKGPDLGDDRRGYPHGAVIDVLRHRYGVPGEEARAMVARADQMRAEDAASVACKAG